MPIKQDGTVDWSKLFMGFAVALVFVMQAYHSMKLEDFREHTKTHYLQEEEIEKLVVKQMERMNDGSSNTP